MSESYPDQPGRDQTVKYGKWCIIAGVLLSIAAQAVFLASPLFVASFILGIVAMTRGETKYGLIILLLSMVIPPVLLVAIHS